MDSNHGWFNVTSGTLFGVAKSGETVCIEPPQFKGEIDEKEKIDEKDEKRFQKCLKRLRRKYPSSEDQTDRQASQPRKSSDRSTSTRVSEMPAFPDINLTSAQSAVAASDVAQTPMTINLDDALSQYYLYIALSLMSERSPTAEGFLKIYFNGLVFNKELTAEIMELLNTYTDHFITQCITFTKKFKHLLPPKKN
jgi:hypothetical protein